MVAHHNLFDLEASLVLVSDNDNVNPEADCGVPMLRNGN